MTGGSRKRETITSGTALGAFIALLALMPSFAGSPVFRTDILPILTKAGCNAGACHGAATGQGGFRLSLLGYDPDEDFLRITREHAGRRIDLDAPTESLVLRKAARQLHHEGGRRLPADSDDYAAVREWIAQGAPAGPSDLRVASIHVSPDEALLPATGATVALHVEARYTDGSRRDVTRHALYTSNDDAVAAVSKDGLATAQRAGLTSIMVRYGGQVDAARIAVPYSPPRSPPNPGTLSIVDTPIEAQLARLGLEPSPPADPATLLRRVTLDLAGRLPDPAEVRAFLQASDPAAHYRQALESLLSSQDAVDLWTHWFSDLLLVGGRGSNGDGAGRYHAWLRKQIARNTPIDQLVRELLTAEGDLRQVGPAHFFTLASDPRDLGEHVSRMFLGTRLACARCHAHPSDRWTQDDYHAFAAYFARVGRDGDRIQVRPRGEVDHPKSGRSVDPRPLEAHGPLAPRDGTSPADRRVELARWVTAPDNPFFARSLINRVWKHCFGRGLVEPVDDLRPTNPATHPELLDHLVRDWVEHQFDLRHLLRTLTTSQTYQRTSQATPSNRLDDRLFARAYVRPLPAAVFLDAIAQATGVPSAFDNHPPATRALQLASPQTPSMSLDLLGRCGRDRPCDPAGNSGGGLARALHLINGPLIHEKLTGGILEELLASNTPDPECVQELYFRTLSRPARPEELAEITLRLAHAPDRREALEDFLWALLNSREFGFNH